MTDRDENHIAPLATRRAMLMGAGALGAMGVLAACGTDSGNGGGSTGNGGASPTGGSSSGGTAGIKAADIPMGGGTIYPDQKVVITQPTAGTFKAFSAVCTHQGCLVTTVENGTIGCPCHNSQFSITNGAVTQGPATKALPPMTVTAKGDTLTVS